ncbi:MAG: phosphoribosylanthranilate isomerase [Fidelibacterota bacterium]
MIPVKICGITNPDDALYAANVGASAVGFIFFKKSPRAISLLKASKITSVLSPKLKKVGVFVNHSRDFIEKAIRFVPLDIIQLHGKETPEFCSGFSVPVIKAFRLKNRDTLSTINDFAVHAFLVDTWQDGEFGGTGKTFDWSLLNNYSGEIPMILSGGLNPENVLEAVKAVRPAAIDINSGVETLPGQKNKHKLWALFQQIKATENTGFQF